MSCSNIKLFSFAQLIGLFIGKVTDACQEINDRKQEYYCFTVSIISYPILLLERMSELYKDIKIKSSSPVTPLHYASPLFMNLTLSMHLYLIQSSQY